MASYRGVSRRPGTSIPLPATPLGKTAVWARHGCRCPYAGASGTGNDGPVRTATSVQFSEAIGGTCIRTGTYANHPERPRVQHPTDLPEPP